MFSLPFMQSSQATIMTSNASSDGSNLTGGNANPNIVGGMFPPPQFAVLDFLVPGFSVFSSAVHAYLGIDLNVYIPLFLVFSGLTFVWNYFSEYVWNLIEKHLMSSVRIRTDDEIYNVIMSWVASQRFSQGSRRCIVNTNVNSRSWFIWRWDDEDDEGEEGPDGNPKKKPLQYTPSGGHHYFWYKGSLLRFDRNENRDQAAYLSLSQREEISISCFSRNPRVLKELLVEARTQYLKKDEKKTLIYRGAFGTGGESPSWQRCMTRDSRPFGTVILNEKVKKDLIDDVTDYLLPATRRWYSNRGIPYRRGYLLHGPPGTGKSSLSLALAGFFQMRIYMVSLSSAIANEEHLTSLFAELPRRCVVLLEDIDTAGLTHTREADASNVAVTTPAATVQSGPGKPAVPITGGRLSLSGLLNILDGVASQEGRILIMTTNHLEKLDKALIRPGRVDMIVQFGRADTQMTEAIFRAIYAPYEGEVAGGDSVKEQTELIDAEEARKKAEKEAKERAEITERVGQLAKDFAAKIPSLEFSPAEIQGLLLKHKRNPEAVIEAADDWVVVTRKEKKEKEIEEAEKARKEEEEKKKEEAKKKRKEAKRKARKKAARAKKRAAGEDTGSGSGSDSDSDSENEAEEETTAKEVKKDTADKPEIKVEAAKEQETATNDETKAESKDEAVEDKSTKSTSDSGYDTPDHTS